MTSCPSCHQPVEILDKHLGTLFTCPHCNAVSFIGYNGQPELANHEIEASSEIPTETESIISNIETTQSELYNHGADDFVEEPTNIYQEQNQYIPNEVNEDSVYQNESSSDYSALEQTQDPLAVASEEVLFNVSDSADFTDVTEFANSNSVSGALSYSVTIDGIDSSHLLHQLKEAMTDSRFAWDVQDLLNQVGGGRLVIAGMTPAKASVFINRIKYLPIKISWRQDVLSGA